MDLTGYKAMGHHVSHLLSVPEPNSFFRDPCISEYDSAGVVTKLLPPKMTTDGEGHVGEVPAKVIKWLVPAYSASLFLSPFCLNSLDGIESACLTLFLVGFF